MHEIEQMLVFISIFAKLSSSSVQSSRTEYSLNPDYFYPPTPTPGIVVMRQFQTTYEVEIWYGRVIQPNYGN